MNIIKTDIPDILIIEPRVFGDARGFFYESFNQKIWFEKTGLSTTFVQDNHSRSERNVLRGLHYQISQPQGKLVRVISGAVFDVAVDIRKSSPYFGRWVGTELSEENRCEMWIPEGFAHGFLVLSDFAEFLYKTTDYWNTEFERSIIWNDPSISIKWPQSDLKGETPKLSAKDNAGTSLSNAEVYP
jgi:dTDP-4-dehydrorhamnose 3,5-epimerase